MPPKRSNNSNPRPKRGAHKGSRKNSSEKKQGQKTPAFWSFTRSASKFRCAASELATILSAVYGPGVSISHFETFVSEVPTMSAAHREMCDIPAEAIEALTAYLQAKEARDAERLSFRSETTGRSITAGLEAIKLFQDHSANADGGAQD